MQQLLTGAKLLTNCEQPNSSIAQRPNDWQKVKLSSAFERNQRTTTEDVEAVLSITAKIGFVHQREKFNKVIAGQNLARYILLKQGEFAYNKGNSKSYPQGCVYLLENSKEALVPNVYICFKPRHENICVEFYKYYFENGLLNHQLNRLINTGVRNDGLLNIDTNDFFNIKISIPLSGNKNLSQKSLLKQPTRSTSLRKNCVPWKGRSGA